MAQKTQLSPLGLPGPVRTFSAKAEAAAGTLYGVVTAAAKIFGTVTGRAKMAGVASGQAKMIGIVTNITAQ